MRTADRTPADRSSDRAARRRTALWWTAGVLIFAVSSAWTLHTFLIQFPDEIWQVDLEVYREGSHSLIQGRQVYSWLTDNPQYLPFTYPPFGALMGTLLVAVPFRAAGWIWAFMQLGLLWICTGIAFRPFLQRFGGRRGLPHGAIAAVLVHLLPVQDGIRFGQVNAIIVTLCLADVARQRAGWWDRGSLSGIAAAIKLTPAVFWVHYALNRRWRTLGISVGVAAAVTGLTALFVPSASAAYWADALLDPERLGPNIDTSNQSLRGMLMRVPVLPEQWVSVVWAVLALAVAVGGFWLASRLDRLGERVAVVGVLGMLAVLISPVSWIHHLHWGIVVIAALLGDGRQRRRIAAAVIATGILLTHLPWSGQGWRARPGLSHYLGIVAQQSFCWFAVLSLPAIWWLLVRGRSPEQPEARPAIGAAAEAGAEAEAVASGPA